MLSLSRSLWAPRLLSVTCQETTRHASTLNILVKRTSTTESYGLNLHAPKVSSSSSEEHNRPTFQLAGVPRFMWSRSHTLQALFPKAAVPRGFKVYLSSVNGGFMKSRKDVEEALSIGNMHSMELVLYRDRKLKAATHSSSSNAVIEAHVAPSNKKKTATQPTSRKTHGSSSSQRHNAISDADIDRITNEMETLRNTKRGANLNMKRRAASSKVTHQSKKAAAHLSDDNDDKPKQVPNNSKRVKAVPQAAGDDVWFKKTAAKRTNNVKKMVVVVPPAPKRHVAVVSSLKKSRTIQKEKPTYDEVLSF